MSEGELQAFLRHSLHYEGGGVALRLGERGGVPSLAATVDLAGELRDTQPHVARQVLEPSRLLLKPALRPVRLTPGFNFLHKTYPAYVRKK